MENGDTWHLTFGHLTFGHFRFPTFPQMLINAYSSAQLLSSAHFIPVVFVTCNVTFHVSNVMIVMKSWTACYHYLAGSTWWKQYARLQYCNTAVLNNVTITITVITSILSIFYLLCSPKSSGLGSAEVNECTYKYQRYYTVYTCNMQHANRLPSGPEHLTI